MTRRLQSKSAVAWAVVLLFVLLLVGGWGAGVRMHYLTTPSMGTALPVGSLVVTAPASTDEVAIDDVVTTRLQSGNTRTHRVIEVKKDGLVTQGDLNGAIDAGLTTDPSMVGKVVWSAPALGWVVQMLPWILGMWVVMWIVSRPLTDRVQRSRYRTVGLYLGFSLSIIVLQPLLGMHVLSIDVQGSGEDSRATATAVSTGLLPIKLVPAEDDGTESAVMYRAGETGEAVRLEANEHGEFVFIPTPVATWPVILILGALAVSPWVWFYLQYRNNREIEMTEDIAEETTESAQKEG